MYSKVNLDELEAMDTDRTDPDVKAVGFELRPEEMRPNVTDDGIIEGGD